MKKPKYPSHKIANPVKLVWLIIFLGSFAWLQIAIAGWWAIRDIRIERENLNALRLRLVDARSLLEQRIVQKKWEYNRLLDTDSVEIGQGREEEGRLLRALAREYQVLADDQDLSGAFRTFDDRIAELDAIYSQCLHWARMYQENSRSLPLTRKHTLEALGDLEQAFTALLQKSGSADFLKTARFGEAYRDIQEEQAIGEGDSKIAGTFPFPLNSLTELRLLVERIRGEENIQSLLDLKDYRLRSCLADLHRGVDLLPEDPGMEVGNIRGSLKGLEEILLGTGYAAGPSAEDGIVLGLGGLLNQTIDRLSLRNQRDGLREKLLRRFDDLRDALREVVEGVEVSTRNKAVRVEEMLKKAWQTILFVAFSAAAVFLVVSLRIISEIRKQIRTIEDANRVLDARTRDLLRSREELSEAKDRLEYLSGSLLNAQENERRRISRELHDELGQSLALLKLRVRDAEKSLGRDAPPLLKEECQNLRNQINEIIENVRRLSRDLSPVILEDLGLEAAVEYLAENFSRLHKVKVDLDLNEIVHLVSEEKQRNVYRILQEVLTNAGKHSQAGQVSIAVRKMKNFLQFRVEDDGVGFDPEKVRKRPAADRGLGLAAMAERVRLLGGRLDIVSSPGKGTSVNFTAPI